MVSKLPRISKKIFENKQSNCLHTVATCGVPQESILGPLLFLIHVVDIPCASDKLESIMFTHYTNLFYSHRNIYNFLKQPVWNYLILGSGSEPWKLTFNIKKSEYTLFHETLYEITYHLNYLNQTFLINQLKG